MARRINLDQIGNYATEKYEQLLRVVVLETDSRLKYASPVDTGRLRLSWAISEQGTPGYDPGPQNSVAGIAPPRRLDYQVERAGNVYHIHNNLPYTEPVLYGNNLPASWQGQWRSKNNQITKGYPDVIAREMTNWAQQQASRIARQD
jgi:hypothetical protein